MYILPIAQHSTDADRTSTRGVAPERTSTRGVALGPRTVLGKFFGPSAPFSWEYGNRRPYKGQTQYAQCTVALTKPLSAIDKLIEFALCTVYIKKSRDVGLRHFLSRHFVFFFSIFLFTSKKNYEILYDRRGRMAETKTTDRHYNLIVIGAGEFRPLPQIHEPHSGCPPAFLLTILSLPQASRV